MVTILGKAEHSLSLYACKEFMRELITISEEINKILARRKKLELEKLTILSGLLEKMIN